ncbi:MAG: ABC transporter permease [Planctomycetes bacterium GWF2_41_51]|nr:MAG: ABC transporter permease [Planctomycetes bacterium GWF2_41_51]HBG27221.1 ABC transporter permease [Phycisphaerales bacterium]
MEQWTEIINSDGNSFSSQINGLWKYRDLILELVKRDFILYYKQTLLGPLWFIIQPILTVIVFTLVFGQMAGISTDGLPCMLFYLAGVTFWNYFSESFRQIAGSFIENQNVYSKVYFPRFIIPVSIVISNLIKLGLYFVLLAGFYIYYINHGYELRPNYYILLLPVLIATMGMLSMGMGMIIASLTCKYRDLKFLLSFGIQLMMYVTPVIYPLSATPEKYRFLFLINPMTIIIETFKFSILGKGSFSFMNLFYGIIITLIIFFLSLVIYAKIEKDFIDTI